MVDVKYTADFSQFKRELDEITAKVEKLNASLEKTSKKFGEHSPQATMVKHAIDRAMADLDKKISKLDTSSTKGGSSGVGGDPNTNRELEIRFKRESLKYYRDFSLSFGRASSGIIRGLSSPAGIFNPAVAKGGIDLIQSFRELNAGLSALKAARAKVGISGTATAAGLAGSVLGPRGFVKMGAGGWPAGIGAWAAGGGGGAAAGGGVLAAGAGAAGAGAAAGAAGTTTGTVIGILPGILKAGGVAAAISAAAGTAAADLIIAGRGAARGRYAAGLGTSVGGVSAGQLGFERYVDPSSVMAAMAQAKYDITSPAFTALRLLHVNTKLPPEEMMAQTIINVSKKLKDFGNINEQQLLTRAHPLLIGPETGLSDEDLIRIYKTPQKDIEERAKQMAADIASKRFDLSKDEVKTLQDNVQWMKSMATQGETTVEHLTATGTKWGEAVGKFIEELTTADDGLGGLAKGLNAALQASQDFGKFLHDWLLKNAYPQNMPSPDATPFSLEVPNPGGGFKIPGTRGGIYARTTNSELLRSKYNYPAISGTGKLTQLITDEANAVAKKYGVDAQLLADTMEGIRAGESGHGPRYDFNPGTSGHPELSYGPFQLNRLRGMGVQFEKETAAERQRMGLGNLTDPKTIHLQAHWVAEYLARGGSVAPWMGFHGRRHADPRWGESGYDPNQDPYKKSTTSGPTSMNDMRNFQTHTKLVMTIHNAAGANYAVHGGMLGSGSGNYGSYG